MTTIKTSLLSLALGVALLIGAPAQARDYVSQDRFQQTTVEAVNSLSHQLQRRVSSKRPLLVTSAQNLDQLEDSDTVGRLIGELVQSTLSENGYLVREIRLRESLRVSAEGEHILSRDLDVIAGAQPGDIVIASTFSKLGGRFYVTVKAVRLQDGLIVASQSFVLNAPGQF